MVADEHRGLKSPPTLNCRFATKPPSHRKALRIDITNLRSALAFTEGGCELALLYKGYVAGIGRAATMKIMKKLKDSYLELHALHYLHG